MRFYVHHCRGGTKEKRNLDDSISECTHARNTTMRTRRAGEESSSSDFCAFVFLLCVLSFRLFVVFQEDEDEGEEEEQIERVSFIVINTRHNIQRPVAVAASSY